MGLIWLIIIRVPYLVFSGAMPLFNIFVNKVFGEIDFTCVISVIVVICVSYGIYVIELLMRLTCLT